MSPYQLQVNDYPAWAVFAIKAARSALYTCSITAGVSAVMFTPHSLERNGAWLMVSSMIVFGAVCLVGVLWQRYVIEWISLFFLSAGMTIYVASIWVLALGRPSAIAGASFVTMLVLFLIIRLVELTVFWLKNYKAAKLNREMSNE